MAVYMTVALINLFLNTVLMYILVDGFKAWYMLAQFIASGLIAIESYLVYKTFIFNVSGKSASGKLKILIATGIYPPDIGGPATYAVYLKTELEKSGCEIKIIAFGQKDYADFQENIFYISRGNNILVRYFKFFIRTFRLADWADVIYTLDLISAGLPAVLAAAVKRKKIIFRTGGDFLWEKAYQNGWTNSSLAKYYSEKKNFSERLLMFFCRRLLNRINLVVFSTEFQKKLYQDYYKLPEAKIKLIPNASPRTAAAVLGAQPGNSVISAGRLIKLKNLSRLICAFAKIKNNNLKLIIFGQGPERENLMALIKRLSLECRVEINDRVGQEKLISLIGGCRFFILPSITEISPNLALECLSLKKPIILTKETGLPAELVNGLITVDPMSEDDIKNKIEYLMDDEHLLAYQNSLGRLAIEPREWEQLAAEHLNIFKDLK
jgi:glycosyltransferase involved in cell wall biosynthesis